MVGQISEIVSKTGIEAVLLPKYYPTEEEVKKVEKDTA
jgi:hypothetical protein